MSSYTDITCYKLHIMNHARHAYTVLMDYLDEVEQVRTEACRGLDAVRKRSVLQCVAVCCSVLQCVAVWCSVLQCVAV